MKFILMVFLLGVASFNYSNAQILRKIKDKANSVINKDKSTDSAPSETAKERKPQDGNKEEGNSSDNSAPLDPDKYTLVYKPSDDSKATFLYDESCLGINTDGSGYMVVLYDSKNKAEPFIVIEDGKITGRFKNASQIPNKCEGKVTRRGNSESSGIDFKEETEKNLNKYVKSETKGGMPSHTVTINGKSYGPFMAINNMYVSPDSKTFFIDAYDATAVQSLYFNDKKVNSSEPGLMMVGELLFGPDNRNMLYLGIGTMEMANMGKEDMKGTVIYPDGTKKTMVLTGADLFNPKQYKLTAKNEICWIDKLSGQFYADGKPIGKFSDNGKRLTLNDGHYKLLAGADAKTSVLFTEDGKIHFLDGTTQELTLYPFISVNNGVTSIKWFKTRGNEIYLGHYDVK